MRHVFFAIFLVVVCATGVAAGRVENADSAYKHGNYVLAARLYRPLAEQGEATAQFNLGVMYANGLGISQNFALAHMWFSLAAAASSGDVGQSAINNRNRVASRMTPTQIEKAQEMAQRCQETKFKECE